MGRFLRLLSLPGSFDPRLDAALVLQGRLAAKQIANTPRLDQLADAEFRVSSQWGEDGIIEWLINKIPACGGTFVEFGVENYRESNTRFLLQHRNWRGLVLDGNGAQLNRLKHDPIFWRHDLTAIEAFITPDNINEHISKAGFDGDIGLLSIDIDGQDFWVLEALDVVSPKILVCEYNAVLGDLHAITVPRDPNFRRLDAHWSGQYFGASLAAIRLLAERKGYVFCGTNSNGVNAFFVRSDAAAPILDAIGDITAYPSTHRDSLSSAGQRTFVARENRAALISDLPVMLVTPENQSPTQTTLSALGELYSDTWKRHMNDRML